MGILAQDIEKVQQAVSDTKVLEYSFDSIYYIGSTPEYASNYAHGLILADQSTSNQNSLDLIQCQLMIRPIVELLFTLMWLQDPVLRRRTNAGLNKGQTCNALASAVFLHRLGESAIDPMKTSEIAPAV